MALTFPQAYKITGSRSEAEILRRISFWQPKAKIKKDGHMWIIKPVKDFIEEGTPYSASTIKRALNSLCAKDYIEIKHSYNPFAVGPNTSWIRLKKTDDELLSLIE